MISIFHFGKILLLRINIVDEKSEICKFVEVISLTAQSLKKNSNEITMFILSISHFQIILYELSHLQAHQG